MLFFMKELAASNEDSFLIQNPIIFTKLEIKTLIDFDFDSV